MSYAVKEERHEPIISDHQLPLSPVAEAGPGVKEKVKEVLSSSHTLSKDLQPGNKTHLARNAHPGPGFRERAACTAPSRTIFLVWGKHIKMTLFTACLQTGYKNKHYL